MSIDECYEQYMVMAMIISQVTELINSWKQREETAFAQSSAYTSALKHLQTVVDEKYPLYNYDNIIDAYLQDQVRSLSYVTMTNHF